MWLVARDARLRGVGVEESTPNRVFAGGGVGVDSFSKESESAETRQKLREPAKTAETRQNFDEIKRNPLKFWKN